MEPTFWVLPLTICPYQFLQQLYNKKGKLSHQTVVQIIADPKTAKSEEARARVTVLGRTKFCSAFASERTVFRVRRRHRGRQFVQRGAKVLQVIPLHT